jgi:hypothetical protein
LNFLESKTRNILIGFILLMRLCSSIPHSCMMSATLHLHQKLRSMDGIFFSLLMFVSIVRLEFVFITILQTSSRGPQQLLAVASGYVSPLTNRCVSDWIVLHESTLLDRSKITPWSAIQCVIPGYLMRMINDF